MSRDAATSLQHYAGTVQASPCRPDYTVLLAALGACSSSALQGDRASLEWGRAMHRQVTHLGLDSNVCLSNTLVDMYAKCGSLWDASRVFDRMLQRTAVSWSCLIMGYARKGEAQTALQLYALMRDEIKSPDRVSVLAALEACCCCCHADGSAAVAAKVRVLHAEAATIGCEKDVFVVSSLINAYTKCGSLKEAHRLFSGTPLPNRVCWTCIILGYAQAGQGSAALELFAGMQREGVSPNGFTFMAALKACMHASDGLSRGRAIHIQASASGYGATDNVYVGSTLVDMYAKLNCLSEARSAFDAMHAHNAVTWSAMVTAYACNGEAKLALHMYAWMQAEGFQHTTVTLVAVLKAVCSLQQARAVHALARAPELHVKVASSLMDVYAKYEGRSHSARRVFQQVQPSARDTALWNCIITVHAERGEAEAALRLYSQMTHHATPDVPTFLAALKACTCMASLEDGRRVHSDALSSGLATNTAVANSLVDMYAACGAMAEAVEVFESVASKSLVTWCSMMTGQARHGNSQAVLGLFRRMQRECQEQPSGAVFLVLLTACSHAGLVHTARDCLQLMYSDYGLRPGVEHYGCMIDVLARANRLEEAVEMATTVECSICMPWTSILAASSKYKDVRSGCIAFRSLLHLGCGDGAEFILMATLYREAGMLAEASSLDSLHELGGSSRTR